MQLHRSMHDRAIGGVCAGLAESLSVEAIYLRLAFLFFALYAGNGLLVYLILWIVLPVMEISPQEVPVRRLYRSRENKMLGGVCGGLAQVMNVDPAIIRLAFVGLTFLVGGGVLIYLLLWLVMPEEPLT